MRKPSLTVVSVAMLIFSVGYHIQAQQSRVSEREAEWNQYRLPQSTFVRQIDPSKAVLFQVPSEWERQQSDKLNFLGPHGATLSVFIEGRRAKEGLVGAVWGHGHRVSQFTELDCCLECRRHSHQDRR